MYELVVDIEHWIEQKKPICLATVISTWGSSPRQPGSKMAITADYLISGSVSAGCVEGAVIEAAVGVLKSGNAMRLHYGVADETALNVGLTCGGEIDIIVRPLDAALFHALRHLMKTQRTTFLLTVIEPESKLLGCEILFDETGQILFNNLNDNIETTELFQRIKPAELNQPKITDFELPGQAPLQVFIDVINLPPDLVIVGGVHIAITLSSLAKIMGFRTVLIDPRKAFCNPERFPHVDQLIQEWPDDAFQKMSLTPNTAVAVVTHDPKIDDPALKIVLNSPAQYIGVLGSARTHEKRCQRLLAEGVTEEQLARLHAPIGFNLGKTPQEIALGILAEIVAVRNGREGVL